MQRPSVVEDRLAYLPNPSRHEWGRRPRHLILGKQPMSLTEIRIWISQHLARLCVGLSCALAERYVSGPVAIKPDRDHEKKGSCYALRSSDAG